jgi:hypothetical protein
MKQMNFTLLVPGSTLLLLWRPHHRWSTGATDFRPSTREIVSPPTPCRDLNAGLPITLAKPDGPSEPRPPLVIREGALTPVLVLALAPELMNELRSSKRKIERRLPLSILVPGLCPAAPLPSPNRKPYLPSPSSRAMDRHPMDTPNPLRLHPSRRPRRDLGRRNHFRPFLLSSRRIPTVSCFLRFPGIYPNTIVQTLLPELPLASLPQ